MALDQAKESAEKAAGEAGKALIHEVKSLTGQKIEASESASNPAPGSGEKPALTLAGKLADRGASGTIEFGNIFGKSSDDSAARKATTVADRNNLPQDMLPWLFSDTITATPGHVHVEKKGADGNPETIVDKTDKRTMVLHGKESVVIENGREVVKGDGYKITWDEQQRRHITLESGSEVVRDGNTLKLIGGTGGIIDAKKNLLAVTDSNVTFIDNADHLKALTEAKLKALQDGQTAMIAIKDAGTRTIFSDGTIFDLLKDHARLETKDHKVVQLEVKDKQLFVRHGGKLVPLGSTDSLKPAENGKFRIGGLLIDPESLSVDSENAPAVVPGSHDTNPHTLYHVDLRTHMQTWLDHHGNNWQAVVNPDNSATVSDLDHDRTLANNSQDNTVAVTTNRTSPSAPSPQPETIKIDLATTNVDLNNKILDEPNKTTIKDTHTVIDKDRTVHLGGEDGPTVYRDGSVQVDRNTYIDRDMGVHSKDYGSSSTRGSASISEASAQAAAINISGTVASLSGLAGSSMVSWSEVATLNSALGDVLGLMGSVPADTPAYALLLTSYGLLVNAINDATPKAQITENALGRGITSPTAIKAMEQGATEEDVRRNRLAA